MDSEPDAAGQVVALVTDPGGLGIEGATITWGDQVYLTDERGRAPMTIHRAATGAARSDRLHLACPAGFAADVGDRVLPWILLHGAPNSAIHFTCNAQRTRTALVVVVEGPGEVDVSQGDEVLGSTQNGILHALLESVPEAPLTLTLDPHDGGNLEGEPHPVIVAGRSDTYALVSVTLNKPSQTLRRPSPAKRMVPYRL